MAAGLGLAGTAQADHSADEALLVVIDGPHHEMAFDHEGPLEPLFAADGISFANETWTAGPAKTVPGHAALFTGSPQPIANDGSQRPEDDLLWDRLSEDQGWGARENRWIYAKTKLAVLGSANAGGGRVEGGDEAMLDALEANRSADASRLVAASFAQPDRLGHEGNWPAHRASLATIADGLAPIVEAAAGPDTLVVVTADHARYCEDPEDHGRLGPLGAVDDCDAHIPLWVGGWHVDANRTIDACLTQADVGVLLAQALGTSHPDAGGRFPHPLVEADADWEAPGCPPARGGLPVGVASPGPAIAMAAATIVGFVLPRRGAT